jgi:hypothetical protein
MKLALSFACMAFLAATLSAQRLENVYNRDSHEQFKLKSVTNESQVLGPIVKQKTVLTFENPFKKLTEASVWFSLDWATVLSGFGYWYKQEYVPGVLMDKNKAWFIYTAITNRNEDPGIMVQTSPSSYHAQIYPLAVGYDMKVELTSVGFLRPDNQGLEVPTPSFDPSVPFDMNVRTYKPEVLQTIYTQNKKAFRVAMPRAKPVDMQLFAQRHKDGWVYVAGLVRRGSEQEAIKLNGLKNVMWTKPQNGDTSARWFIGRRKGAGSVSVQTTKGKSKIGSDTERVKANAKGPDTAKLWAHQVLVQKPFRHSKDVLNFSMKFGIPSTQTALLAVPEEQMKLFREKEAEFNRKQAEQARRERAWQNQRNQNWNQSGGGDPEIRIQIPEAESAYAILPDGRRVDLRLGQDGFWGGSYDIPATAAEGEYKIKVVGVRKDGTTIESGTSYNVDRTAPIGKAQIENGELVIRSEAGLARVVAVMDNGDEVEIKESSESGVYRLPLDGRSVVSVVLFDGAHNRTVLEMRG